MNEIKNLLQDVQDNKMEIANLRLDQIIKDKITIAVEQQKIEVANKIFNEGRSEEVDESVNEAIDWDQAITIKDLINYVVVPFAGASFAAAGAAFGVLGIAKTKQKIKDWFADKKDAADAKQSAKLIKDAIEKIKKDSKAQDMIAQINANPYSKTGSNTERNKLIKPYKAHLKAILSKEQYQVLNDIYSESLK
jgi:hypothetical protein